MKGRITNLIPTVPPNNHSTRHQECTNPEAKLNKPPHCKTCGHPTKGHSRQTGQRKCTMCLNSRCEKKGEPCSCLWHSMTNNSDVKNGSSAEKDRHMKTQTFSTAVENSYPGVSEWLLPCNISQSTMFDQVAGNNACTIISVLGAIKQSNNMIFPSSSSDLPEVIDIFSCTMKEGNTLYGLFDVDPHQPNLEVKDVVEVLQSLDINIQIIDDEGFFFVEQFGGKLKSLAHSEKQVVGVLIVAPDKAMLLYIHNDKLGIMDSHQHGTHGALIAMSTSGNVDEFLEYLSDMVHKYWNTSLCGCNLAIIESA